MMPRLETGDVVSIESGRYIGCRLTYVGRTTGFAGGWHVCLNSNEPGGYVRVRSVALVRKVSLELEDADPVMHRGWISNIESAKRATGAA